MSRHKKRKPKERRFTKEQMERKKLERLMKIPAAQLRLLQLAGQL